ncbi:hypothetical protein VOLCADRAFT_90550 [Volvox carteri f. nagariensis]|uniref:Pseudouridine synthase I TruA alpha/beta domain-containing protein n=1 Tax=Volvox carteri f. nagariensis TaxID=3068 RepID=D8TUP7_VOLCA|nr:uncharacterized protein VOLCADRAFT_90550 [Volvox carteri f. nagariensis]EFJ48745.1 hypothetical protein VOLCADRAFT_90550 [Volvox carteri f. nagariensis]|eukprot:XP_002950077.1 hypothetical protein VOLCADRAFT_90550 [Volvox carteri f. nagariensis]
MDAPSDSAVAANNLASTRNDDEPCSMPQTADGDQNMAAAETTQAHNAQSGVGEMAAGAANQAAAPASAAPAQGKRPKDKVKRSVAIHTGYVGTGYKAAFLEETGSSINRTLGDDVTIEQVMGLRMLVDESCYVAGGPGADTEGLVLADSINRHLPSQIRVFTVQKTNKKFSARHMCEERVYQYYLPASMIDLKCDGGEEDAAKLAVFRDALSCFQVSSYVPVGMGEPGGANVQYKPGRGAHKRGREREEEDGEGEDCTPRRERTEASGAEPPPPPPPLPPGAAAAAAELPDTGTAGGGSGGGGDAAAGDTEMRDGASGGGDSGSAATAELPLPPPPPALQRGPQQPHEQSGAVAEASDGDGDGGGGGDADGEPEAKRPKTAATLASAAEAVAVAEVPPAAGAEGEGPAAAAKRPAAGRREGGGRGGGGGGGRDDRRRRRGGGGGGDDGSGGDEDDEEEEEGCAGELDEEEEEEAAEAEAAAAEAAAGEAGCATVDGGDQGPGTKPSRKRQYGPYGRKCVLQWQMEMDPRDRVTQTYYRRIHHFTAADPRPLVEGGTPCLLLEVRGQSFMLHHIRHMIGGAVAVALGLMPKDVLLGSLEPPARVAIPRAPPHTLLLADCTFGRFPQQCGPGDNDLRNVTGVRLSVRAGGQQRREDFRRSVLLPALQQLVELAEWGEWKASLYDTYPFPQDGPTPPPPPPPPAACTSRPSSHPTPLRPWEGAQSITMHHVMRRLAHVVSS